MSKLRAYALKFLGDRRPRRFRAQKPPLKACAWARVSTDELARSLSISEQLREIRRHAEILGGEIIGEFADFPKGDFA